MVTVWRKPGISGLPDVETDHEHAADPSRHDGAARAVGSPIGRVGAHACYRRLDRFLLLHPLGRGIKIFGAVVAVPLVIMSIGGWFGVWSVELGRSRRCLDHPGTISEFVAIGFLVYATMSREAVNLVTTQRLVVLLFGVTAFGTMHQSAEFILLASSTRRPRACRAIWGWARRSPSA